MPTELSVALKMADETTQILAAPGNLTYGILEFFALRPLYSAQLYQLYRYCKITAVDVNVQLVNTGASTVEVAIGYVPQLEASTATYVRLAEKTGSLRKIISAKGGLDRVTFTRRYGVEALLGEPVLSKYWMTNSQSLSITPLDVNEPVLSIAYRNVDGSTSNMSTTVRITYHCQFFSLELPATS
jgi:hypothetical protein